MTTQEFIKKYSPIAIWEHIKTGIPASVTLAQGIIESNSGNSTLSKYNNFFGIKAYSNPNGVPVIYMDDDAKGEPFRTYASPSEGFSDHSQFLITNPRYRDTLTQKNYADFAKGLQIAGYATAPLYAQSIINTIEKNNLSRFDFWGNNKYIIGLIILLVLSGIIYTIAKSLKTKKTK